MDRGDGGGKGMMLFKPGRIKAKGERQKVRRSMLPATRNPRDKSKITLRNPNIESREKPKTFLALVLLDFLYLDFSR